MTTAPTRPTRELRRAALLHMGSMSAFLVVLVAGVFVVPVIAPSDDVGRAVNDLALTLILLSGAAAVVSSRPLALAAAALCVVAIAIRWSEWIVPSAVSPLVHSGSALLALLLLTMIVAARVFAAGTIAVTADRVVGAIVLYLLLGIAWAVVYDLVAGRLPDAFAGVRPGDGGAQRWLYFSFVTLTTVGYGDITPVAPVARSLAALEALVGQLYPAIILARLVSLQGK